jgi:hypothetical protein
MRYFLVNYYQKPTGQMDEVISVSKRTRIRDLQTCSVILDFKTRSVVKCSVGNQIGTRDFQTVRDYYHSHYAKLIDELEQGMNEITNHTG